jgi:hypothetical protein
MDIEEKIRELEKEIHDTQKNKATEKHIGLLKARIARLEGIKEKKQAKGKGVAGLRKKGDATCAICGPPSVGKSSLLNKLTSAKSKVAEYNFTTLKPVEGMMIYKGAYIQLLDTPGLIEGATNGKGRGREVLSSIRISNLLVILLDPEHIKSRESASQEIYHAGIRLNRNKPAISLKKTDRGGIEVLGDYQDKNYVVDLAKESGVSNATIMLGKKVTTQDIIDFFSRNVVYVKGIWVLNKADNEDLNVDGFDIQISVKRERNIESLKEMIFSELDLIQVYTDRGQPVILKKGSTVRNLCRTIHKDFELKFKGARLLTDAAGNATRGKKISINYKLAEGDRIKLEIDK